MPNLLDQSIPLEKETYAIIGAALEVHKELGCVFAENVYQEAFEKELISQGIPYKREEKLEIQYKGTLLSKHFYADFICYDKVVVELKALSSLNNDHTAQVLNYLKATNNKVGLLINFGEGSLVQKRLISPS